MEQTFHMLKSYEKTVLVIRSCKNPIHLQNAQKMVDNFKMLFPDAGYAVFLNLQAEMIAMTKN